MKRVRLLGKDDVWPGPDGPDFGWRSGKITYKQIGISGKFPNNFSQRRPSLSSLLPHVSLGGKGKSR